MRRITATTTTSHHGRTSYRNPTCRSFSSLQKTIKSIIIIIICCIFYLQITPTQGFASNLIVTTIGCMTDLSTEEVIMNNVVISPEESDYPKMHLVVIDNESGNHIESPYHYNTRQQQGQELTIAFINPYSKSEFIEDIQFVMEIDSSAASFIDGGTIGCENDKRVAARLIDDDGKVVLKINDPTSTIRIWSGWATGQNSVRLTPYLILVPNKVEKDNTEREEEQKEKEKERELQDKNMEEDVAAVAAEAAKNPIKKKKNLLESNEVLPELNELVQEEGEGRPGHHNTKQKILHNRDRVQVEGLGDKRDIVQKIRENNNINLAESVPSRNRQMHKIKVRDNEEEEEDYDYEIKSEDDGQKDNIKMAISSISKNRLQQIQRNDEKMRQHRAHIEEEMRRNFEIRDIDMIRHFIGCGFFIVCMGIILLFASKKKDKGRRDL